MFRREAGTPIQYASLVDLKRCRRIVAYVVDLSHSCGELDLRLEKARLLLEKFGRQFPNSSPSQGLEVKVPVLVFFRLVDIRFNNQLKSECCDVVFNTYLWTP